jgi:GDSL-like Lipase/Acylhydrolase family/N-terminus of Esterase_SGNH_hydro-type
MTKRIEDLDPNLAANDSTDASLDWHEPTVAPFRLTGFAWLNEDGRYRRLPVSPKWPIRMPVDTLADCTAGGQIQFQTDSTTIALRVELADASNMNHMPATGQCGFDLYIGPPKAQQYFRTAVHDRTLASYEAEMLADGPGEMMNCTLNFPLYMGVKKVEIGLAANAQVLPPPDYDDARPIIVYGTSITQGGCAARPGMAYTNILSRWLNRPVINLGFSGNGKGEPELAYLINTIPDPACVVLDFQANCYNWDVAYTESLPKFIDILRTAQPETPILLISRMHYPRELFPDDGCKWCAEMEPFQKNLIADRCASGDGNLHFLSGTTLLGEDWHECTVDGAHPTDLGFYRMAQAIQPVLEDILES